MELPDDFSEMTYQTETSVEKEYFLLCETCGVFTYHYKSRNTALVKLRKV